MSKNASGKGILICTFLALSSGLVGGYIGGQLSMSINNQSCNNQRGELLQAGCQVVNTPRVMWLGWQGSITGVWTGTILGAFVGGLIRRSNTYQ